MLWSSLDIRFDTGLAKSLRQLFHRIVNDIFTGLTLLFHLINEIIDIYLVLGTGRINPPVPILR